MIRNFVIKSSMSIEINCYDVINISSELQDMTLHSVSQLNCYLNCSRVGI
jgi:hypothetical protein